MNNIEEKLWEYIDGRCTADDQKSISELIARDEATRLQYHRLLAMDAEFSAVDLDEPPMAFTYNVMEGIRTQEAQQPLKATINKRIIMGIAGFFVITILALLVYVVAGIRWSSLDVSLQLPENVKLPAVKSFISTPVLTGFLFFDVVLGLFLFDTYLRKKSPKRT